jgi:hypothetical protein
MAEQLNCKLDFEIDDALAKLLKLELATNDGEFWQAGSHR